MSIEKIQDEIENVSTKIIGEIKEFRVIDSSSHHYNEIELWEEKKSSGLCGTCGGSADSNSYSEIDESKTYIPLNDDDEPCGMDVEVDHDPNLIINRPVNYASSILAVVLDYINTNTRLKYLYMRDTVNPLPSFVSIKTKTIIVRCILVLVMLILLLNVILCNYYGLESSEDGEEDFVNNSGGDGGGISAYVIGGFKKR
jgi:hypothetical protein